jgi:hypothetical protein
MRQFRPFRDNSIFFFGLLFCGVGSVGPLLAQQNHCDPQLKQSSGASNGYRLRGDRCEGIYAKEVGSTTLLVASLVESVEDFNPASDRNLFVEWNAPGKADIRLRAQALWCAAFRQFFPARLSSNRSVSGNSNSVRGR